MINDGPTYYESFKDIESVAERMVQGKIGIFPSKNGYMLVGCGNEDIADKIRHLKQKTVRRPLVRIISSVKQDTAVLSAYNAQRAFVQDFIDYFMYSKLIVVFKCTGLIEFGEVGVAFALSPYERCLSACLGQPYFASSANLENGKTPFKREEVPAELLDSTDFLFNAGSFTSSIDYPVFCPENNIFIRGSSPLVEKYMNEYAQ
jgi:tRNA A37 threonylcarbamoyladenosine synthetase subunit TsaC/SUA5/YrdC